MGCLKGKLAKHAVPSFTFVVAPAAADSTAIESSLGFASILSPAQTASYPYSSISSLNSTISFRALVFENSMPLVGRTIPNFGFKYFNSTLTITLLTIIALLPAVVQFDVRYQT